MPAGQVRAATDGRGGRRGNRLIAMHTSKGTRRYHYYVNEQRHHGDGTPGMRVPVQAIEQLVTGHIAELCSDPLALAQRVTSGEELK